MEEKTHLYSDVEISDMVNELSFIMSPTNGQRPECLCPTLRGSRGSVPLWRTFFWHGFGPLVSLEGRVTANQYKVVLSDDLYPMMKHFYLEGRGLF